MGEKKDNKAGVNRSHDPSVGPKWVFALGHFAIVLVCAWLIYGNGQKNSGQLLGKTWHFSDIQRAQILLLSAVVYWIRHVITLFYLLVRKVEWSEVFGLLVFIASFEIGLVLLGGGAFRDYSVDLNALDLIALILLLLGSPLNSYSETQRKWWKSDPANKGHCYTGGLFKYSMHINYFGDTVLFTGWCLLTANLWSLMFPLFMGLSFYYFHIPGLDSYLADRYGAEFTAYSQKTKKLIPFIV